MRSQGKDQFTSKYSNQGPYYGNYIKNKPIPLKDWKSDPLLDELIPTNKYQTTQQKKTDTTQLDINSGGSQFLSMCGDVLSISANTESVSRNDHGAITQDIDWGCWCCCCCTHHNGDCCGDCNCDCNGDCNCDCDLG